MIVKSIYHKRLSFVINEKSIGIDPNQIITVDKEIGEKLLESPWITDNLAGKCSKCSTKKPKIESPKVVEVPEMKRRSIYQNIDKREKTIEKPIKIKKVEEKNNLRD